MQLVKEELHVLLYGWIRIRKQDAQVDDFATNF